MFEDAEIAPEAFTGNEPGDVGKDVVGFVAEQRIAIRAQLVPAGHSFLGADFPAGNAVVGDLAVDVDEVGAEEADFLQRVIADSEDSIAEAGGLHQGMFVIAALIAEDIAAGEWKMPATSVSITGKGSEFRLTGFVECCQGADNFRDACRGDVFVKVFRKNKDGNWDREWNKTSVWMRLRASTTNESAREKTTIFFRKAFPNEFI